MRTHHRRRGGSAQKKGGRRKALTNKDIRPRPLARRNIATYTSHRTRNHCYWGWRSVSVASAGLVGVVKSRKSCVSPRAGSSQQQPTISHSTASSQTERSEQSVFFFFAAVQRRSVGISRIALLGCRPLAVQKRGPARNGREWCGVPAKTVWFGRAGQPTSGKWPPATRTDGTAPTRKHPQNSAGEFGQREPAGVCVCV